MNEEPTVDTQLALDLVPTRLLAVTTGATGAADLIPGRCVLCGRLPRGHHVSRPGLPADHVERQDGGAVEGERRGRKRRRRRPSGPRRAPRGTGLLTRATLTSGQAARRAGPRVSTGGDSPASEATCRARRHVAETGGGSTTEVAVGRSLGR